MKTKAHRRILCWVSAIGILMAIVQFFAARTGGAEDVGRNLERVNHSILGHAIVGASKTPGLRLANVAFQEILNYPRNLFLSALNLVPMGACGNPWEVTDRRSWWEPGKAALFLFMGNVLLFFGLGSLAIWLAARVRSVQRTGT